MELLAAQEHSKKRLTEKLRMRGYEETEIDGAVARLEARHYLDDEAACAREFQHLYEAGAMSLRQIQQKLLSRGFSAELIRASAPEDPDREDHERAAAVRSLGGRFRSPVPLEKMKQFLYRRGFSYGTCDAAAERFLEENPQLRMEETEPYEE